MNYLETLGPMDQYNQSLLSNVRPADWVNPTPKERYNLVVIGAGTAGLVAAAGAAGLGAKVALIERGLMGGDCLNVGCIPSKAVIAAARHATAFRNAANFGIEPISPRIDFAEVARRMRRIRASISPHDSADRFTRLGVDVYFGQGSFTSNQTVTVQGQNLRFKKAVIATGARATLPSIDGLRDVPFLTNESLFSLTELPKHLVVIGGGPIGCEMAQSFARLGAKVTLVERSPRVLVGEEEDAALIVQQSIQRDGVALFLGAKVIRVDQLSADKVVVVSQADQEREIVCDQILVATGRTANLEGLGLDAVGVAYDPLCGVEVNDRLRTTNRNIYAAGDVCSKYKFTHAADFLARIVIQNALFMGRAKASDLIIPHCTYTSPEIAHVGTDPSEAARHGIDLDAFTQPFSGVDRAIVDGHDTGFLRVYCGKGTDRIVGATIVAERAGEMIGEIVLAMKHRIGLRKIASIIHPYPTQIDGFRRLGDQFNRTKITPNVKSLLCTWFRLWR